jgi:hypothetical protein
MTIKWLEEFESKEFAEAIPKIWDLYSSCGRWKGQVGQMVEEKVTGDPEWWPYAKVREVQQKAKEQEELRRIAERELDHALDKLQAAEAALAEICREHPDREMDNFDSPMCLAWHYYNQAVEAREEMTRLEQEAKEGG